MKKIVVLLSLFFLLLNIVTGCTDYNNEANQTNFSQEVTKEKK